MYSLPSDSRNNGNTSQFFMLGLDVAEFIVQLYRNARRYSGPFQLPVW